MTSFFVQNLNFWVSQIYFVMSLWPGLKFNSPVMWKASHSCNSKQVCVFFKRYFMVSGRKLRAILCPSLKGHSFVCVTVIGLKSPDISSRDSSVHYRSLLSWLAHWEDLWLKSWRETGRQKQNKKLLYTLESDCVCACYTLWCCFHVIYLLMIWLLWVCMMLDSNSYPEIAFARKEL